MRLSVCMIVRNEGQRLVRALESVRGLANEVVVTDTGSTDDTVAIAESFGARVNHFEWTEDFAAARNLCAQHARGEWQLWLDGDERVKPGTGAALNRELADPKALAYFVMREEIFFPDEPERRGEMLMLRLLRADAGIAWEGRIHEHPVPWPIDLARESGRTVPLSGVRLEHWGYTRERIPEKCLRSARMCEAELRERPGQLYYLVEWARSLIIMNTPESFAKAADVLREGVDVMMKAADDPRPPSPLAASLIEQLLAMPAQRFVPIADLLALAHKWFPTSVPLVWAEARVLFDRAAWPAAEARLRQVLDLVRTGRHDRIAPFDPRVTEDATFNLGVCLVRQAKLAEAERVFKTFATSPRRGEEARANLKIIEDLRGRFGV